jgi:4-hydroxy-3-polyprenylbenzoate decarboxylase
MWGAGQMMFNKILVLADGNVKIDDYRALAQYVFNNVNPVTDIYFSQGPMDVLDHSCSKLGFGGKMCIDGTRKWEEEITEPLLPFKLSASFNKANILAALPEITSINENLAKLWDLPVLFVATKKDRPGHVRELHNALCAMPGIEGIKIILYVEYTVNADDIADVLWRFCNNLDPRRDNFFNPTPIQNGSLQPVLGLDGTRKTKKLDNFDRPWPNIIAADPATIATIDKKWPDLGLGKIIISPSLRYSTQLYRGGASVLDNE